MQPLPGIYIRILGVCFLVYGWEMGPGEWKKVRKGGHLGNMIVVQTRRNQTMKTFMLMTVHKSQVAGSTGHPRR